MLSFLNQSSRSPGLMDINLALVVTFILFAGLHADFSSANTVDESVNQSSIEQEAKKKIH